MISGEMIDDFFGRYSSAMNNALFGDVYAPALIIGAFSEYVVGANPLGIAGGKNDEHFRESIQRGIDFYKQIGITSMNIISRDVTMLDECHAMIRVSWTTFYSNNTTSGEIPFEVVYLIQSREGVIRIFAYITGDEQQALREHKLIPNGE
jgi:hypothetical protein